MTLTPEALEEIKARVEAATPGPWRVDGSRSTHGGSCISDESGDGYSVFDADGNNASWMEWKNEKADARFIAHARQDIPTLIKALEDREAEIERLREALGWFLDDNRFDVSVGGNPHVVEKMIAEARAAMDGGA